MEQIEELRLLAYIDHISKIEAKRAKQLMKQLFNINYNGCLCTQTERLIYQSAIKKQLEIYDEQQSDK